MGSDVRVGRLRVRGARRAADPAGAVRQVEALQLSARAETDHGVLVVRRLVVVAGDRSGAQRTVAELRRRAARPVAGRVDAHADAVLFADQADLLRCLTLDVLDGSHARAWYWRGFVPRGAMTPAQVLGAAWRERPRWVPAVLAELWAQDRATAVRAVALVGEAADAVRRAVLAEYRRPSPVSPSPRVLPSPQVLPDGPSCVPGARLGRLGRFVDGSAESGAAQHIAGLTVAGTQLLDAALGCAGAAPRPTSVVPLGDAGRQAPQTGPRTELNHLAASAVTTGAHSGPAGPGRRDTADRSRELERSAGGTRPPDGGGAVPVAHQAPPRTPSLREPRGDGSPALRSAAPPAGTTTDEDATTTDEAAAPAAAPYWQAEPTASGLASALYVINLLGVLGLTGPGRPEGLRVWRAVDELARWACRCAPSPRRRGDPLWGVLARLDGRPEGSLPPRQLGARMARAKAVLTDAGVAMQAFRCPGTVLLTRTHLDIVLDLEDVDLTARLVGIDQDPGWVPELGRIVAFHFVAATFVDGTAS